MEVSHLRKENLHISRWLSDFFIVEKKKMIDCHTHLTDEIFTDSIDDVVQKAKESGVKGIVVVGVDLNDSLKVLELCSKYDGYLHPCIGIHPERIPSNHEEAIKEASQMISLIKSNSNSLCGVGEIGLDFTAHVPASRETQVTIFEMQIQTAVELNLPVNVHSRMAGHYAIESLVKNNCSNALLHAFDGRSAYARKAATEHSMFFSIPPSFVQNKERYSSLIKSLPTSQIVLETDSPALSAVKGNQNNPSEIYHSLELVADSLGQSKDETISMTTSNAVRLFHKIC